MENAVISQDSRPADVASPSPGKGSYQQILKSSALIGGSQTLNIAIGIIRTKAMALLLGPGGFGVAGLYNSIVDLTQNLAGLGVNSSGVRQIAEAVGSNDTQRITLTIAVLRRTSILLGLIGAIALLIFARPIARLTFGNEKYAVGVAILSVAAFCKLVSGGQAALIQGTRRIADLAKMNVLGALFGAIIGIAFVYFLRDRGIVMYVVAVTATAIVTSWWYARKVKIPRISVPLKQVGTEVSALLKLGVAFMISSLMTLGVAYAIRITVLHKVGIEATGLYQSAWTLGGLYVGFILQAMAADFYPRLTASVNDHPTCNRLVNEQARVGLLLAGPGVLATLTFAPIVIAVLYSSRFGASVPLLRWICLGATLQVITWPMGFIIVAKGKQNLFIFSEVTWAIVSLALAWVCIGRFGLNGAGIAFFLSYVFHGILVYPIARYLSGFRWSRENLGTGAIFLSVIATVFCAFSFLPRYAAITLGSFAVLLTSWYSVRLLLSLVHSNQLQGRLGRLAAKLGIAEQELQVHSASS
ncbi:MAG TPA: O-antigen translocase [Terriglobales bacterium]|nr:O-antigen translocase [Terriglobales bacterium]